MKIVKIITPFLFTCISVFGGINDTTAIAFSPSSMFVAKDSIFNLAVTVDSVTNLFSVATDINFPAGQFQVISISEGTFLSSNGTVNTSFIKQISSDKIMLGLTRLGAENGGVSSTISRTLLTIRFKKLTTDTVTITFSNSGLLLPDGVTPIPLKTGSAVINGYVAGPLTARLFITPTNSLSVENTYFSISLAADSAYGLYAYATDIIYNPNLVKFISSQEGIALNTNGTVNTSFVVSADSIIGKITIGHSRLGAMDGLFINDAVTLSTFTFQKLSYDTVTISLSDYGLIKNDGISQIPVEVTNGICFPDGFPISISTSFLTFGDLAVSDSSAKDFKIYNLSKLNNININDLSIQSPCFFTNNVFPFSIPANDSILLTIYFKPSSFTNYSDTLTISFPGGSQKISLTGTSPFPTLNPNYSNVDFGTVSRSGPSEQIVIISTTTVNGLIIDSIYTATSRFSASLASGIINKNETLQINLTHWPYGAGEQKDTLYLRNNSNTGLKKIPLKSIAPATAIPQSILITDSSSKSISLQWRKNQEIDFLRYYIYRDTLSNPTTKVDSTMGGITDTTKVFSGLTSGKRYYLRITAVDSAGNESGFSDEVSAIPLDIIPPDPPANLNIIRDSSQIILSWYKVAATDVSHFRIYKGESSPALTLIDSTSSGDQNDTTRTIGGLTNGVKYYFLVSAVDSSGNESTYSNEVNTIPVSDLNFITWYPFNNNANDESGYENNGTNNGSVITADRFRSAEKAYSFNSSYIEAPSTVLNRMPQGTVSVFIKLNQLNVQHCIIDKTITGSINYFQLIVDNDNRLRTIINSDGAPSFSSNTKLNSNRWYLVTVTWDGTNLKYYLNGSPDGEFPCTAAVPDASHPVLIGKTDNNTTYFDGILDEVRIYDRALSDAEISQLYANYHAPDTLITEKGNGQATLKWSSGRIDEISRYLIYRDGIKIDSLVKSTPYDTVYTATGLTNYQDYQFYITSVDIYGNESQPSDTVNVFLYEIVTDYDGNTYSTVKIGEQIWLQQNLNVTHYRSGEVIPEVTDPVSWPGLNTGAYCNFNNDAANANIYGRLYNFYTTIDSRYLCPTGWHVPTDDEWKTLEMNLGMTQGDADNTGWRGTDQGTQLKSTSGWNFPGNGTNTSHFTALPGEGRNHDGTFGDGIIGYGGYWWSSTVYSTYFTWYRSLYYANGLISRGGSGKELGFSVRCLKGEGQVLPAIITAAITAIDSATATNGGIVTSDGGSPVTARGVCWSITSNPTIANSFTADSLGTGSFTSFITGLTKGTTYYVRAYATNSIGTSYGSEIIFTTRLASIAAINRATTAPVIDGVIDAVWADADVYNIDKPFISETPTLGASGTTTWQALWTPEGIFVLLQVNDDVFMPAYAGTTPDQNWMYDKPEIWFDVNAQLLDGLGAQNDGNGNGSGHYQFAPSFIAGEISGGISSTAGSNGAIYSYNVANPSYIAEYFIPYTKLLDKNGKEVLKNAIIGFDVTIIDSDITDPIRNRAVWANTGRINESWYNMDECGTITLEGFVPVTGITVLSEGGAGTIETDRGTLQMSAAFQPVNASIQNVKWRVINGTGAATISTDGLLTAMVDGTVTVTATSKDNSDIFASIEILISNQAIAMRDLVFSLIGNAYYLNDGAILANWNYDIDLIYSGTSGNVSTYKINNLELLQNGEFMIRKDYKWIESYGYNVLTILGDTSNFVREFGNIKVKIGKIYEISFLVDSVNNTKALSFNTLSPTIITTGMTSVSSGSASCGGEVINEGIDTVTTSGICWSTVQNPTISDSFTSDGSGTGPFISSLTGLMPITTYFVRAYVTNSLGTFYGNEINFFTLNSDAAINSLVYTIDQGSFAITNIPMTETLASFKGNLTSATDATFEVYQGDGISVAIDLQTGYQLIVTAQDGFTTRTYTITVNASLSNEASILALSIEGTDGIVNSASNTVSVTLPYGTDVSNLLASFIISGGSLAKVGTTVQISGVNTHDFTNPVSYDIYAEDGITVVNWTVTVFTLASSDATVSSNTYIIDNSAGTISNILYVETLANFKTRIFPSSGAAFEVYANDEVTTVSDLQTGYKLIVTAQDGVTTKIYTIYLSAAPSTSVVPRINGGTPTIDGLVDPFWTNVPANNIDLNFTGETPSLGETGTTTWKAVWNDTAIFILLQVNDDIYSPAYLAGAHSEETWLYDKPEIYFDVNTLLANGIGSLDGNGHYQVAPAFADGLDNGAIQKESDDVYYAQLVTNPTYVAEYLIPFAMLLDKDAVEVSKTATIGFDVTIIDNDLADAGATNPVRNRAVWSNIGIAGESYVNMDGCGTISLSTTETINLPAAGNAASSTTICSGSSASLTLTGYSGNIQWQQSADGLTNWISVLDGEGANSANYITEFLYDTAYFRAEVTESGYPPEYSNVIAVIVTSIPESAGPISGLESFCPGQVAITYTVTDIANAISYEWTLPEGATGSSITNTISVSFTESFVPGTILVNGLNDCGIGASSTLDVSEMGKSAAAGVITGPSAACVGENSITYAVPVIENADSYVWTLPAGLSGTSTSNSIDVDFNSEFALDFIEVYGLNSCYNGASSSIQIKSSLAPSVAGTITGLTTVCLNQEDVLYNVATITNASEYIWTLPKGATGTLSSGGKIITIDFGPTSVSGIISVKGHSSCDGPSSSKDITIKYPYQGEQICLVTIDTATGKNMVVWEKTKDVDISSYLVYRESNVSNLYTLLTNSYVDSLSVFLDITSEPELKSHKYFISVVDNCGNESAPSKYHEPIYLSASIGTDEKTVNLEWTEYKIGEIGEHGTAFLFNSYIIYRSTSAINLLPIDTIPSDMTLYADINAPGGNLYYRIAGLKSNPCDPADFLGRKSNSGPFIYSFSNITDIVKPKLIINVSVNNTSAGSVSGPDQYEYNELVTLQATALDGFKFVNWTENDEEISKELSYSFYATRDRDLVANFEMFKIICSQPTGALSTCQGLSESYTTTSPNALSYEWKLTPVEAGSISPDSTSCLVTWNSIFTGSAQISVRGIYGSIQNPWYSTDVTVNPFVPVTDIKGPDVACSGQVDAEYFVSANESMNFNWSITGGGGIITSDPNSERILVSWISSGTRNVNLTQFSKAYPQCSATITKDLFVWEAPAPQKPKIKKKPHINILICTTPNQQYQWFKDGNPIQAPEGIKQFYWADKNVGNYQVEVIYGNGCIDKSISVTVDLTNYELATLMSVFPNPAKEFINIELESEDIGGGRILVYDSYGSILMIENINKNDVLFNYDLDVGEMKPGIYIIEIEINNLKRAYQKLVVQ